MTHVIGRRKMFRDRRCMERGFTLVELLVVLVIIGVLAGALLLTYNKAQNRSRAAVIISDMGVLRSAATLYFMNNGAWPETTAETWTSVRDFIGSDALVSNPQGAEQEKIYAIRRVGDTAANNPGSVWVIANVNNNSRLGINATVREMIAAKQAEYGLVNNSFNPYKATNVLILMPVYRP